MKSIIKIRETKMNQMLIKILVILISFTALNISAHRGISKDSRIKNYRYNKDEVYLLVLHHGFQSHIEFDKNETIETITLGDTYAWKITPLANRLFIKPLERNMRTNMTVITNKRTYQFDIVAKELLEGRERDLVYVMRFNYPKKTRRYR